MENKYSGFNKKYYIILAVLLATLIVVTILTSYAFFSYNRVGASNLIETNSFIFDFSSGSALTIDNRHPISNSDSSNYNDISFSITARTTFAGGIPFNIYVIPGDSEQNLIRMPDSIVKMKFTPPADGDGFSITTNNYSSPTAPQYTNGKCLIATGLAQNVSSSTAKNYTLSLWIDDSKVLVSSTTKRATLAEGNPSLVDLTSGTTTAGRYIKNDNVLVTTTLYPASVGDSGKIVMTTNEFKNSYYSVKIAVEAHDNLS